eukprot:COSAG06_NODE_16993_length_968_cov_1.069045_1_plen_88_part_00
MYTGGGGRGGNAGGGSGGGLRLVLDRKRRLSGQPAHAAAHVAGPGGAGLDVAREAHVALLPCRNLQMPLLFSAPCVRPEPVLAIHRF